MGECRSHNLKVRGIKGVGGGLLLRSELMRMMIDVKGFIFRCKLLRMMIERIEGEIKINIVRKNE